MNQKFACRNPPPHCQWTNTISSSANSQKNSPFIPAAASAQLFAWFAHIGERRQALCGTMQAHGRCEEHAGWIFCYLQPGEQEAARAALNAHAMLGAYINN